MTLGLGYFGGKQSHLRHILPLVHGANAELYLEPYFGGGAVFFNKGPHRTNIINDIDDEVVNFFSVLREEPEALMRSVDMTPYAREEFRRAIESPAGTPLEMARRFVFKVKASVTSHPSCVPANFSASVYRELGEWRYFNIRRWAEMPEVLEQMSRRLKDCLIEKKDAVEMIEAYDLDKVVMYVDPPYMPETLSRGSDERYREHADTEGHPRLLDALVCCQRAKFVLSGYRHPLYDRILKGMNSRVYAAYTKSPNKRKDPDDVGRYGERGKREECLWWNFDAIEQRSLL